MGVRTTTTPLAEWARQYLGHYFTAAPSEMHGWLCKRLERLPYRRGRRLAVIAPRGSAKTTWVSKTYPLYCIVHELEPYIMLVSDTAIQAEKNLGAIRHELESNEPLARDYPNAAGAGPVWSSQRIETRNRVCVEAVGRGTRIRGRTFGPHRPTLMIIDDVDNDESVESARQREKAWNWLQRALLPAGTAQTNVLAVGTALHRDDVMQNLLKTPGWRNRVFRALIKEPKRRDLWRDWESRFSALDNEHRESDARAFYDEHRDEMERGALLLWPEREPLYELMCLRATIGEPAFQAEKQGRPTSARTAEWPDACFDPSIWFDSWPETRLKAMALDPSKGRTETSDYSAYVTAALGLDGLIYVDADLARRDTTQIVEDGLELARRFRPDGFMVEVNSFQELLQEEIERQSRERGMLLPIYGMTNTNNKRIRIRTLTPYLRTGRLRFKSDSTGAVQLVEQLREFPTGRYDDGPDALEMALRLLRHLSEMDVPDESLVELVVT